MKKIWFLIYKINSNSMARLYEIIEMKKIKLNGQPVSVVHKDKHLGTYISDSTHA